jgi:S-adenosylmethionine/arginine decarboxylase-like enzyme
MIVVNKKMVTKSEYLLDELFDCDKNVLQNKDEVASILLKSHICLFTHGLDMAMHLLIFVGAGMECQKNL